MRLDPGCRAVCFDMDGTLLDTKVDYSRMTELILNGLRGYGVPEELLDPKGGYKLNIDKAFTWMYENRDRETIQDASDSLAKVARDLEMERVDEARPFPGVPEMLEKLKEKGYRIGVLTRGCREYAETALGIAGVDGYIEAMVCRDDYAEADAKPNPIAMRHLAEALDVTAEQITYVGDHKMDWMCARDASSKFVAVTSGTFTKQNWESEVPGVVIIPTCAGIIDMI